MRTQNNHRLQLILLASIAAIILFGASVSIFAQTGLDKKYGSRDPRPCGDTKGATLTQD